MITDKDARALVTNLREIADLNRQETSHLPTDNCWRRCCESRAQAYDLAAKSLEKLIPKETKQ